MNQTETSTSNMPAAEATSQALLQSNFTLASAPVSKQPRFKLNIRIPKKVAIISGSSLVAAFLIVGTFVSVSNMQAKAKQAELQRTSRVVVL